MNKFDTSKLGGYPYTLNDIEFNDNAIRDAFNNIFRAFGDSFIFMGCAVVGTNVSAGYVLLDGELLKVDAHVRTGDYYQKISSFDPAGNMLTQDGAVIDVYVKNRAVCMAGSGTLSYNALRIGFGYSRAEIDQKFNDVIGGAPAALNALNELATALGNDPNFATTISTALGNRYLKTEVYNRTESMANAGGLLTKSISIGDWDMSTYSSKSVAHGLDYTKIRSVEVWIRDEEYDNPSSSTPQLTPLVSAGGISVHGANIELYRTGTDWNYNSGIGMNRGFITIKYIP